MATDYHVAQRLFVRAARGSGGRVGAEAGRISMQKVTDSRKLQSTLDDLRRRLTVVRGDNLWNIARAHYGEGLRYTVEGAPQVVNARSVPAEQLEQLSKVKAGQYYSDTRINTDKRAIEDYIGYMGREARVTPTPVYMPETPGLVRLQYEVAERQPARVGQVIIVGNERTKQNVILRQVPLYSGQVLTYPDLRVAERNLAKLNIFETNGDVRPTVTVLDPESDSEFKDLLVQVQETTTGSLLFGVGVAFHIYFVMAWRGGATDLLQSSLARAVLFSALATGTAFGSLWLSHHPGTASMGKILMLSLAWTLKLKVPAVVGVPPRTPALLRVVPVGSVPALTLQV